MHVLFGRVFFFFSGKFEHHISNQVSNWVSFKAMLLGPEREKYTFVFFSPESGTGQNQHQEVFPFQVFNVPLGICSITK